MQLQLFMHLVKSIVRLQKWMLRSMKVHLEEERKIIGCKFLKLGYILKLVPIV